MHEMLHIVRGRRVAMQVWFACDGQNPGWARPQRVAWGEKYGWGGAGHSNETISVKAPPLSAELQSAAPWPWR